MNVRIVYDAAPVRHIAVQCPECGRWFDGQDITNNNLSFTCQVLHAQFECPICGKIFGGDEHLDFCNVNIKEVDSFEECYAGCLFKKEVWE